MSTIDLDKPPPDHKLPIPIERVETAADQLARLFEDLVLFLAALTFVSLIVWLCYQTLASNAASPEEKKWAMSVLSAAAGGVIGYLIRR